MIVIARIGILRGLGNTQYRKSQWWIEMSDTYQAIYEAVRSRIPSIDGQAVISAIAAQFDFSYYAAQIKDDAMNILYEQQRPSMLCAHGLQMSSAPSSISSITSGSERMRSATVCRAWP